MAQYSEIRLGPDHGLQGKRDGYAFSAWWPLFVIRHAWDRGLDLEDFADGFGAGQGTHGDWSAIRDSSHAAIEDMTEAALNHLFGEAVT